MVTHVLDTSTWLAHMFREPGYETVTALMLDPETRLAISAVSLVEAYSRMKVVGVAYRFPEIIAGYKQVFVAILPVDEEVSMQAIVLGDGTTRRIPATDATIAATAAVHSAILVHRDPHFGHIPDGQLRQLALA